MLIDLSIIHIRRYQMNICTTTETYSETYIGPSLFVAKSVTLNKIIGRQKVKTDNKPRSEPHKLFLDVNWPVTPPILILFCVSLIWTFYDVLNVFLLASINTLVFLYLLLYFIYRQLLVYHGNWVIFMLLRCLMSCER